MSTNDTTIEALREAILARWGQTGDWNASGVDRAAELAQLFASKGITDLSQLGLAKRDKSVEAYLADAMGLGTTDPTATDVDPFAKVPISGNVLTYGGQDLGYFNPSKDILFPELLAKTDKGDNEFAWSAAGKGNVGYTAGLAPDGSLMITPTWGSSSDKGEIMDALKGTAFVLGAGLGIPAAANALGLTGAASAGEGFAALGADQVGALSGGLGEAAPYIASSADKAAMFGDLAYGAGMTGAETAAFDAALAAAGAGGAAAPYVMTSADKAALFGLEGYGTGMTGAQTLGYDTLLNLTGSKVLADTFGSALGNVMDFLPSMPSMPSDLSAPSLGKTVLDTLAGNADWIAPVVGGIAGAVEGGKPNTATSQSKMDPRMDSYVYGSGFGDPKSVTGAAYNLWQANPSGMNDTMRQALEMQKQTLLDPNMAGSYAQMRNAGMGLLGQGVAPNPFTSGQIQAPAGLLSMGASAPTAPKGLMDLGRSMIPKPVASRAWAG